MFSIRAIACIIFPFLLPHFLDRFGIKYTCIFIVVCCMMGQIIFMLGLQQHNYFYLLLSRFIFGVSDSMTIVQQIVMCTWFNTEQLPIAFGFLLFLVKMARAINDNSASIIYNYYHDLLEFFSIGLYVCIFSFFCAILLTVIHEKATLESDRQKQINQN
tara:strand:- start:208 stop:684 length:477 start_codon:yes stop_codon:yes gene_type:complete